MFLYKWRPTNYVILCHDFHNCPFCLVIFFYVGLHVWMDIRGTLPMLVLMEARSQQHWRPFSHHCLQLFFKCVIIVCVWSSVTVCVPWYVFGGQRAALGGLFFSSIESSRDWTWVITFVQQELWPDEAEPSCWLSPFYLFNYFRPGLLLYLGIAIFAYPGWPVSLWYSSVSISLAADLWGHAWPLHGCWGSVCLCSEHFFHWTVSPAQSLYVCM